MKHLFYICDFIRDVEFSLQSWLQEVYFIIDLTLLTINSYHWWKKSFIFFMFLGHLSFSGCRAIFKTDSFNLSNEKFIRLIKADLNWEKFGSVLFLTRFNYNRLYTPVLYIVKQLSPYSLGSPGKLIIYGSLFSPLGGGGATIDM